jgi:hypothetical protein
MLPQVFVSGHRSALEANERLLSQHRRYNYITPVRYLDAVRNFRWVLPPKRIVQTLHGEGKTL